MSCIYVTVLGRPCGRPAPDGKHCDFHAVLYLIDGLSCAEELPILLSLLEVK